MPIRTLLDRLMAQRAAAAARDARQRRREDLLPLLSLTPLEERRLLNAAPVAVPDAAAAVEDATLSVSALDGVLKNDSDADGDTLTAVLDTTTSNGKLNLNADGSFDYSPNGDFNGTDSFTYRASDGSLTSNLVAVTINVAAVNDPPVNVLPAGPLVANEDTPVNIPGVSINDVDTAANLPQIVTKLSVTEGTLSVGAGPATIVGNNTDVLQLAGSRNDINTTLATLSYHPNQDYNGPDTLSMDTKDIGAVLTPGYQSLVVTLSINVLAVNDPPVVTLPGGPLSTNEDTGLAIMGAGISDVDTDANLPQITTHLNVAQGTLSVTPAPGVMAVLGNGTGDLQIVGTRNQLNATLATLSYMPNQDYNGPDLLTMDAKDLGAAGGPGFQSNIATVAINVVPVNDPPVNTLPPGPLTLNEDTPTPISGAGISDVDTDPNLQQVVTHLSVEHGTLSATTAPGVLAILGNGTTDLQITGSRNGLNASLATLVYTPDQDYNGPDLLTMDTKDLGAAGGPGFQSNIATLDINVLPVNDPPVNSLPAGPLTTQEDTALIIGGAAVSDVDTDPTLPQVNTHLSVEHGTLSVTPAPGLITVVGNGTADVQIVGSRNDVNSTLATLVYLPGPNYTGPDLLTMDTKDLGAAGGPGFQSNIATVAINVVPVNDPPVNVVPGPQQTHEDTPLPISGISTSDVDAAPSPLLTQLSVTHGTLNVTAAPGVIFVTGNGKNFVQVFAPQADLNATLATLVYTPDANFNGPDTLTVTTSDLGATGDPANPVIGTDTDTVAIKVIAVNDPPVNVVPGPQQTHEDTPLPISGISTTDVDASPSPLLTQLSVTHGTLTVVPAPGIVGPNYFVAGNGTSFVQIFALQADLNATLATLVYTPEANYNGPDTLTVTTNDLGATGDLSNPVIGKDTDTVAINVIPVNDPPVNTVPGPQQTHEDTPLPISGISTTDVDAAPSPLLTQLSVTHGTLNVTAAPGVIFVAGNGTNFVQIFALQSDLNATLATLVYTPGSNYNGPDTLTVTTSDLGATGDPANPVIGTDTDTVAINVIAVNDPPVNTVPAAQQTNEDTPLAIGGVSTTDVDAAPSPLLTQLSMTHGTLTVVPAPGIIGNPSYFVIGNGTNFVQIFAPESDLNATLATLVYTPDANYSGPDTLTVTTNDLGATGDPSNPVIGKDTDTVAINVIAVADVPTLIIGSPSVSGNEGSPIPLNVSGMLNDNDGSEVLTFHVSNVPTIAKLTDGLSVVHTGLSDYTFTAAEMNGMTITMPDDAAFDLQFVAIATEMSNGSTASSPPGTVHVTVLNVPPQFTNIATTPIVENGTATITTTISDPGVLDTFTVTVDWKDGTPADTIGVLGLTNTSGTAANGTVYTWNAATRELTLSHQYLDDGSYPGNGTASDTYLVALSVTDDDLGASASTANVLVSNVAPILIDVHSAAINENETATIFATIVDPGTKDVFTVSVDWKDGTPTDTIGNLGLVNQSGTLADGNSYTWDAATRLLTLSHQYLDNNGPAPAYSVALSVADDDTGISSTTTNVVVSNVAPTVTSLTITPNSILENNVATLTGTFTDPSPIDSAHSFTVIVYWGDKPVNDPSGYQTLILAPGQHTFTVSHLYLDDFPTNTPSDIEKVSVQVIDKDGGVGTKPIDMRVTNVPPTIIVLTGTNVSNLGNVTITGTAFDPGADTFNLVVDWGDGTETKLYGTDNLNGNYTFNFDATHHYDQSPNQVDPSAPIAISVKIVDDDTGVAAGALLAAQPGTGAQIFFISPLHALPQIYQAPPTRFDYVSTQTLFVPINNLPYEPRQQRGDTRGTGEASIALASIDPVTGEERIEASLPVDWLDRLPELFKKLPDGRYRLYYDEQQGLKITARRLIMDVVVRRGKPIDPTDDSEGTLDRPPTGNRNPADQPALPGAAEDQPQGGPGPNGAALPVPSAPQDDTPHAVPVPTGGPSVVALPSGVPSALAIGLPGESDYSDLGQAEVGGGEKMSRFWAAASPPSAVVARTEVTMGESAEPLEWAPADKYRRGLVPAAVAVAASMVWTSGRWARHVEGELANSPEDSLSRAARIRRRLRRSLPDRSESPRR